MMALGMKQRWRAPLGDRVVAFAPHPCGGGLITRSGSAMVGLDRDTGEVLWQSEIPDGTGLTACFQVIDDVAITEVRDSRTKRSHFYAYEADGRMRWRTTLDAMARGVVRGGAHEVAAIVDTSPKQLVTIDARDGKTTASTLPFAASTVARISSGRWILATNVPGRDKPGCYVLDGDKATPVATEQSAWGVCATANVLLVLERDGMARVSKLVARDEVTLAVKWQRQTVGDAFAVCGSMVIAMVGAPEAAIPAAFDLATGETCWERDPLPKPAVWIAASPPLVMFVLSSGAGPGSVLYTIDGILRADHDGHTSRELVVAGSDVYLIIDGDAVALVLPAGVADVAA